MRNVTENLRQLGWTQLSRSTCARYHVRKTHASQGTGGTLNEEKEINASTTRPIRPIDRKNGSSIAKIAVGLVVVDSPFHFSDHQFVSRP